MKKTPDQRSDRIWNVVLCTTVAPKGSNFCSGIAVHAQFLYRQRNGGTGKIYDIAERG